MSIFSEDAMKILRQRYFLKNEQGEIIEDDEAMLERVAGFVASVEKEREEWTERFYEMMAAKRFLPNSPTLANAGKRHGQLAACFVLPVPDSIEGIFEAVKKAALIQKTGGGTGFSFSGLRPKGAPISSTGGAASGPVSFITVFNCATEAVKQGGMRKGANMAILDYWHPDIGEFIEAKKNEEDFTNFNFSVAVDDDFMSKVLSDGYVDFRQPGTGKPNGRRVKANEVFNMMIHQAWEKGEPGVLFSDCIDRGNTVPGLGALKATNPCGEQPLFDYESCNLGSLNLAAYLFANRKENTLDRINWNQLKEDIYTAVRFLDNVIDVNYYVFPEIAEVTGSNRKIGLGIMGFADFLIELGIPYASEEALKLVDKLMGFINQNAAEASSSLGKEKGSFPNIDKSLFRGTYRRNATVTTIAPTGTISMLAGVSSGIEPHFGLSYIKEALNGRRFVIANERFANIARERGIWSEDLGREIAAKGSLRDIGGIPDDLRQLFKTALDITPDWHLRIQAAFQKHVENAVSKTINFPNDTTPEDIRDTYLLAWKLGCKGITIYRTGSRKEQVLKFAGSEAVGTGTGERCSMCTC